MAKELTITEKKKEVEINTLPQYKPPVITTYTSEEIEEKIGPALTCSPAPCITFM